MTGRRPRSVRVAVAVVVLVVVAAVPLSGPIGSASGATCTTISEATVITESGCYVVGGDVEEHEDGDYITVEASDVVVDGDGHALDGEDNNNAVHVDGSYANVTVRDLTVRNWDRGVFFKDVTDGIVRNVDGTGNKHAVEFDTTASSTVDGVTASSNVEYGLYLKDATGSSVVDSTATGNGRDGLFVDGGDATVTRVRTDGNTEHGVHLKAADGSTVRAVTATGNGLHGVYAGNVADGLVADSTADDNAEAGFRIHHSDRTLVTNVTADRNAHGVHLSAATARLNDSTLTANAEGIRLEKHVHTVANVTVESSTDYGIYLDEPDDNDVHGSRINDSGVAGIYFPDDRPENNRFYDNYLNNSDNVRFANKVPPTDWNVSRRTGTNVVGGSLVGGNYWAAPDGSGPSQVYDNADGDAFLDTPYTVAGGATDDLALTDVTAAFDVTPSPVGFGTAAFGSTTARSLRVESRVSDDVTVETFDLAGDTASVSVASDPSPVTLSTGESTTVDVTLAPATSGSLSATLTTNAATDAFDTETALTATVTDSESPTAATGADATVDEDTPVSFDGSGSTDNVGIDTYDWAFGDGTTATGAAPTHTYDDPGTYTAVLTVTDTAGNTDTATRELTVADATAPVAEAGSNRTVHVDEPVSFDGSGSTDNVGVDTYAWTFGDSTADSGEAVTHTYTSKATYTVTLTATDAAGNTDTDTATIEVVDATSPIARPGPDRTVDEDAPVTFDGSASTDNVGVATSDWAFGTGDTATGESTTYTFSDPGTYAVTLTVEDDANNVASNETLVTVRDVTAPTVDAGTDTTVEEDTSVSFTPATATDNVGVASYTWAFGDGNTSSAASPSHTYATPGTYTATLTATDAAGNTASDTRVVTVTDVTAPVAAAGPARTVSVGDPVTVDGSASTDNAGIDAYDWSLGDGSTASGASPSHTYATPGTYTATLTATDAAGNSDSDTTTVYVSDTTDPVPDAGGDRTVTVGDAVTLDAAASTDDVGIDSYAWAIDGTTRQGDTVTETFDTPGTYAVTLTVRDAAGNRASESVHVTAEADSTAGGGGGGGGGSSAGPAPAPSTPGATTPAATNTPEATTTDPAPTTQSAETAVTAGDPASVAFEGDDGEGEADAPDATVGVTEIGFTPSVSETVSLRVTTGRGLDGSPAFDREDNTDLLSNVRVGHSIDNADVTDVSVGFRVSTARLADRGVAPEEVALYRYQDGGWAELPTTVVSESDSAVRFRASSPGLSEFAVGAKQPNFELRTVRVAVDEIRVGDSLQVFVRITNDGGADGAFVANLVIDDAVVDSRELTIAAGGRRQVQFERPIDEAGSYTVRVNDAVAGEVIVTTDGGDDPATTAVGTAADASPTVADPGGPDTSGIGPLGVAGAVAAVVVVLGGVVGYYRRRSD